jgi:peptide/nickel transport system substrate-binding protein
VPTSDLAVLDPVVTFNRPTRNYAYLVFDTLYGIDTNWQAQPQMVAGHEVDDDGLTWNLRLREGLRFHDKEPVLARDVVASIRRFAPRIAFATALMAATEELSAPDDHTVRFRLKRPFPHLPEALAGPGGTVPAIMPERLASTSPYQPVQEIVGSGVSLRRRRACQRRPCRLRARLPNTGRAMPADSAGAQEASPPTQDGAFRPRRMADPRLVLGAGGARGAARSIDGNRRRATRSRRSPRPQRHGDLALHAGDGHLALQPALSAVRQPGAARALLTAIDQDEAMIAIAGGDPADAMTASASSAPERRSPTMPGRVLKRPRDYMAAKRRWPMPATGASRSSSSRRPMSAASTLSRIGAEQMRRAGINVDFQEMDFGTVIRRRASQATPDKGGWNVFFTLIDRSIPNTNPFGNQDTACRWQSRL